MATENMDWEAIGRSIARGMAATGNSNSYSSSNPTGSQQPTFEKNIQEQADKQAEKAMKQQKKMIDVQKQREKLIKKNIKVDKDAKKAQEEYNEVTKQSTMVQTKEVRKLRQQHSDLTKKMADLQKKINSGKLTTEEEIAARKELVKVTKEQSAVGRQAAQKNAEHSERLGKGFLGIVGALGVLAVFLKNDIMTQLANASQVGVLAMQKYTVQFGISTETLTQAEALNRQAMNAMGGTTAALEGYSTQINFMDQQLVKSAGGLQQAFEFFSGSLTSLARAGIRPSMAEFQNVRDDLDDYRRIFGMSAAQFDGLNRRLAENASVQQSLRSLTMQERRARMDELRRMIKFNGILGMTSEQAERAATRLAEIGGQGARTRMEQAARLRAMGQAVGLDSNMLAQAQQALMVGEGRRTEEQARALQQTLTQLSNMSTDVRGRGFTVAQEMMFQQLGEGLDIQKLMDPDFNTRTAEAARVATDAALDAQGALSMMGERGGTALDLAIEAQRAENVLMDKFGQALKSATASLFVFTGALGSGALGGLLKGLSSPKGVGDFLKGGGALKLLSRAGLAGAAVGAGKLGYDYYFGSEQDKQNIAMGTGKMVDTVLATFGNDEAEERLRLMEKQEEKMTEANASAQETASGVKTTNDLLSENNALLRTQIELTGGADALRRLEQIDSQSQPSPLYNQ